VPDEALLLSGDADQLRMVLKNLCSNSIQAMPDGGSLDLSIDSSIKDENNYVVISVADTGHGISDENIDRIFLPLFTTRSKGIGFGLSIVRMIVEKHSGTIYVESAIDEGTTFRIELPAFE
jgi:signal transduction histidine kinase